MYETIFSPLVTLTSIITLRPAETVCTVHCDRRTGFQRQNASCKRDRSRVQAQPSTLRCVGIGGCIRERGGRTYVCTQMLTCMRSLLWTLHVIRSVELATRSHIPRQSLVSDVLGNWATRASSRDRCAACAACGLRCSVVRQSCVSLILRCALVLGCSEIGCGRRAGATRGPYDEPHVPDVPAPGAVRRCLGTHTTETRTIQS